ncbi:MAG: hypothetical protein ACK4XY_09010 [Chloroherpetonaceae bacterium]
MLSKLRGAVQLLRPTHWIKNVILFMPMVFSGLFLNAEAQRHSQFLQAHSQARLPQRSFT